MIPEDVKNKIAEQANESAQEKFDHLMVNQPEWRRGFRSGGEFVYSLAETSLKEKEKEIERLKGLVNEFLRFNPDRDSKFTWTVICKKANNLTT